MIGLDTNILIRYLTQDEPHQAAKANALVASALARHERLHLDSVVLCEVVWVLRGAYDFNKQIVADTLERILSAGQFSVDDRDLIREALAAYRAGPGDFADYVIGSRNQRAGCRSTRTFDRDLKRSSLFSLL